ncbi:hypothetical protein GCM10009113_25060 [Marinobacter szutsaonensis]
MSEIFRGREFFVELGLLVLCFISFILFGPGPEFALIMVGSVVIVADHARGRKKTNKVGGGIVAVGVVLSVVKVIVQEFGG